MKEHTAKEVAGHRIRIESSGKIPTGRSVQITDLDTGELILNVTSIQLYMVPREAITVQLTLGYSDKMEDGELTVNNPEIDLTAFAQVDM